jgi:succinate dehydrogenase/fumarate reductase-like Fe-S protein
LTVEEPVGEKESDGQWEKHPDEWEDNGVQVGGDVDQVEMLVIAMGEPPHADHGQGDSGTMRHDRRRRRSDDLSAAISEKVCYESCILSKGDMSFSAPELMANCLMLYFLDV